MITLLEEVAETPVVSNAWHWLHYSLPFALTSTSSLRALSLRNAS